MAFCGEIEPHKHPSVHKRIVLAVPQTHAFECVSSSEAIFKEAASVTGYFAIVQNHHWKPDRSRCKDREGYLIAPVNTEGSYRYQGHTKKLGCHKEKLSSTVSLFTTHFTFFSSCLDIYLFIHRFIHSFIHSCIYVFIDWFIDWLIDWRFIAQSFMHLCIYLFIYLLIDWLKAYSSVNRTGSPQGFSLNQIFHKLNTIQNIMLREVWDKLKLKEPGRQKLR